MSKPLSPKRQCFVDEYLKDLNGTQAAIRAGYSENTAQEQASRLLSDVMVKAAIDEAMAKRAERTQITQDLVLTQLWERVNVDVNNLVEYRRGCCRYCYGVGHEYQWTPAEFAKATREAEQKDDPKKHPPPDGAGGLGYDRHLPALAHCPECQGDGVGYLHIHDSRDLTGAERAAYAGVTIGKDGIKVLIEDRAKALELIFRHLGMDKQKVEVTVDDSLAQRMARARQRGQS